MVFIGNIAIKLYVYLCRYTKVMDLSHLVLTSYSCGDIIVTESDEYITPKEE